MTRNQQSGTTARGICRAVCRHKGKACLFFLVAVTVTIIWTVHAPKVYRSEGKLLVRLGRENATLEPTATLGHDLPISIPPSRETEVNSVVEILESRAVYEEVVDALTPAVILRGQGRTPPDNDAAAGTQSAVSQEAAAQTLTQVGTWMRWLGELSPQADADDRERAIDQLSRHVEVTPAPKSNVIRISYQSHDPGGSRAVVAKIIESFLEKHVELSRTKGASEFFAEQAAQMRAELERKEDRLRGLQDATGLIAPRSQRDALVERISRLEDDLARAASDLAAADAAVKLLQAQRTQLPETQVTDRTVGFSNEGTDFLRDRFYGLQVLEEGARAKYADNHPKLREIQEQVAAARQLMEQEERTRTRVTTTPARLREQADKLLLDQEPVLASLRAKAATLQTQLADVRGQMKTFNENQWQIAKLQREIDIQEAEYRKYSVSLGEARVDQALQSQRMSNISVAQPASFSAKPVGPGKLVGLLAGLGIGLFGAVGLAMVAEYLDGSSITPEDVEKKRGLTKGPAAAASSKP